MKEITETAINSYPKEHWTPLIKFIDWIEATKNFGEMKVDEFPESNMISFPYMVESDLVDEFRVVLQQLKVMPIFDWTEWEKGKVVIGGKLKTHKLTLFECCKMFTALIRSDRFIEGQLVGSFKNGLVLSLLKRIEQIIREN